MNAREKHIPLRIGGLSDGTHEMSLDVAPASIQLPAAFGSPVAVRIRVEKTHADAVVHVEAAATAEFPCDRCLEPVQVPATAAFALYYAHDLATARASADDEDEARLIDPQDPVVDLEDDVRSELLLHVPMRITCGEDADGRSLCRADIARYLAEENGEDDAPAGDPRWDALKALKNDEA